MPLTLSLDASSSHNTHSLTNILPIFLYGSECWAVSVCKIEALNQWCLRMLLGIKWYHSVRNDNVWRQTKQPKLTVIIQARRLTLFGAHCMHWWQRGCQEDFVSLPAGGLEKTTRTLPHHMAKHHPARPEMSQSHTPWSNRHGSESPSVEVAADVRRYAILELHVRNDNDDFQVNQPEVHTSSLTPSHQGLHVLLRQEKGQQWSKGNGGKVHSWGKNNYEVW